MKPPSRTKKTPTVFKFDPSHVLVSQRVAKHRGKRQERDKKRKARGDEPAQEGVKVPVDSTDSNMENSIEVLSKPAAKSAEIELVGGSSVADKSKS